MNPPSPMVRFVGHPVVTGGVVLAAAPLLLACLHGGSDGLVPGIIILAFLGRLTKANAQVTEYRAWKRAWDGMAERAPPRRLPWRGLARAIVAVLGVGFAAAYVDDPSVQFAIALIGLALLLWLTRAAWRRGLQGLRRAPLGADSNVVAIAIRAPLLPVPTMHQAYATVPEHLWCLFQAAR